MLNRIQARVVVGGVVAVLLMVLCVSSPAAFARPQVADTPSCGGTTLYKTDGTAWECTFDDEFNAGTLDTSKWVPQLTSNSRFTTGPAGSQACYVNTPDNISESNGVLNLTVRYEAAPFVCASPSGNFYTQYTAGMVSGYGKFNQTYGRFEVRAKLPQITVPGLQSTLWLWPVNQFKYGPWPASGEIDFAEFYSQYANYNIPYLHYLYYPNYSNYLNYLYGGSAGSTAANTNVVTSYNCTMDHTVFNTYAVVWEPGTITLYTNGNVCLVDNYQAIGLTSPAPFDQPFFLALTSALGVGTNAFIPGSTPLPATTQIDYARIWK